MTEHDDDTTTSRWEGHRYDAPESGETRSAKEWTYLALGLLFVVTMALIVTGKVQIYGA